MLARNLSRALRIAACAGLIFLPARLAAEGFAVHPAPSVTAAKVTNMGCRYFIELLGVHSPASLARQLDPLAGTAVDTVVCCPMGWRFYNYPSTVDLTWREPNKHPRDLKLYPNWQKMVDNLMTGGDPLRDALARTRSMHKAFLISFRMNDSHYVNNEQFPTHNNFWRDHPEYRLGDDTAPHSLSALSRVFDYMIPEVRDFYFSVLEEICTKYDVDGVELDLQRAPRFFHEAEVAQGRSVMSAHVQRIRNMLDRVGAERGRHLQLCVRALPTVDANNKIGADILAWDAAGWLDGITVSPSYIQTADVGIEGFVARRLKARIYGELNFVSLQVAGTGHDAQDRRYVTPETYRAATLSYLERGADGVSFFNTYCVPQPQLGQLASGLLATLKDVEVLKRSDKNYTTYATSSTMFGKIFPAKNERAFEMFIADEIPGYCKTATLRFETKAPCAKIRVGAWINGIQLREYATDEVDLFPPLMVNKAAPRKENLKFFSVPLSAVKFGINQIEVRNLAAKLHPCDFTSTELALYMGR